jgi:hypothetical protein
MATFRVAFDNHWQEDFDALADAMEWAEEVSLTGRTVLVVERRGLSTRFRAGFPQERAREVEEDWERTKHWTQVFLGLPAG